MRAKHTFYQLNYVPNDPQNGVCAGVVHPLPARFFGEYLGDLAPPRAGGG
jgi:hypothetical protein